MFGFFNNGSNHNDERPVVSDNAIVQVMFQMKISDSSAWTTSSATLRGTLSESMMINELSRRHPRAQIRILSACTGKNINTIVEYQTSRDGKSWTTCKSTLQNALTESMARNQLYRKHPNMQVRVLSMITK